MQETPESDPPDATRDAPEAALRPCHPPAEGGPARAAPPPPARTSRAATVTLPSPARALTPAGPATWSTPALLTQLGLTSVANPPPCLRSRVCRERKSGSTTGQPTHGRREPRLRPQRAFSPPQAPSQPPISRFGASTGGACEETERLRGRTLPSLPGCRARPIGGVRAVRGWGLPLRREHGPAHYFLLVGAAPRRVYPG